MLSPPPTVALPLGAGLWPGCCESSQKAVGLCTQRHLHLFKTQISRLLFCLLLRQGFVVLRQGLMMSKLALNLRVLPQPSSAVTIGIPHYILFYLRTFDNVLQKIMRLSQ